MRTSNLSLFILTFIFAGCMGQPSEGDTYDIDVNITFESDDDDSAEETEADDDSSVSDDDDSAEEPIEESGHDISVVIETNELQSDYLYENPNQSVVASWDVTSYGEGLAVTEISFAIVQTSNLPVDYIWVNYPTVTGLRNSVFFEIEQPFGGTVTLNFGEGENAMWLPDGETQYVSMLTSASELENYDCLQASWVATVLPFRAFGLSTGIEIDETDVAMSVLADMVCTETVYEPETVATVSMTGSSSATTCRGEEAAYFGTYVIEISAGEGDKLLTGLNLDIAGDDDSNIGNGIQNDLNVFEHVQSCWLEMGAPISDAQWIDGLGNLDFTGLNQVIPEASPVAIELYCEMAQMQLGSEDPDLFVPMLIGGSGVELEDLSTGDMVAWDQIVMGSTPPVLNGDASFFVHVLDHGFMWMGPEATTPSGAALEIGSSSVAAIFEATSTLENVVIETLSMQVNGDLSYVEYVQVEYLDTSGSMVTLTTFTSPAGIASFNGMAMLVQENTWTDFSVRLGISSDAPEGLSYSLVLNQTGEAFAAFGANAGIAYSLSELIPASPIVTYPVTTTY